MNGDKLLDLIDVDRQARIDAIALLRMLRKYVDDPYKTSTVGAPSTIGLGIMSFESKYGATILETSL